MTWLLDTLTRHALHQPNVIALEDEQQQLSYRTLLMAVDAMTARLKRKGATCLALHGDNSVAWVIADLAGQQAHCVVVPVPTFFSRQQVDHLYRSAGVDVIYHADTDRLKTREAAAVVLPDACSKITFTSGSTGQPKGVCLTAAQQRSTVVALAQRVSRHAGDRHLCVLPLATLLENVAGVYLPLYLGATVVLRGCAALGFTGSSQINPLLLFRTLNTTRPQSLILVPELLRLLVLMAEKSLPVPDSLRFIAVGGGKVDPTLVERAHASGLPAYEGYGLSESGSVVSLNVPGDNRPGCAGKPLSHVQVSISDHGEIQVRGSLMAGYLGDEHAPSCWDTGDLGVIDNEGFLRVSGRRKNLLISSYGRNINPEWVESACQAEDALHTVVVFGDGEANLSAVMVPMPGATREKVAAAVSRVNETLPDYARIHHWVLAEEGFSAADGLATANGRPRRDAIFNVYHSALQDAERCVSH
ncbi:AMP-binding protein [Alcanivorax sp. DP30]|uniref:AMP-binding protein n=1 Tax=Alcanivorax sp. DP30 TaxID=2606217 RepID=UPI00192909E0|nr:AMP-binding protein [Alcanivorax sp. DP30]